MLADARSAATARLDLTPVRVADLDAGNPDPPALRLGYADRDLDPDLLATVVGHG